MATQTASIRLLPRAGHQATRLSRSDQAAACASNPCQCLVIPSCSNFPPNWNQPPITVCIFQGQHTRPASLLPSSVHSLGRRWLALCDLQHLKHVRSCCRVVSLQPHSSPCFDSRSSRLCCRKTQRAHGNTRPLDNALHPTTTTTTTKTRASQGHATASTEALPVSLPFPLMGTAVQAKLIFLLGTKDGLTCTCDRPNLRGVVTIPPTPP